MVFSSYIFIFVFLPIVLAGYYILSMLKNGIYQKLFLTGASLFFYGYFNIRYAPLIVCSILVNYATARMMKYVRGGWRTFWFVAGVLYNIGLLGYFKYYDFFVQNINAVFHTDFMVKNILLPLGISFFTFQQLSFLVSVYKGEEEIGRFIDYSLFVSFFPQLVAGPIVLYSEMIPQFQDPERRYFHSENFAAGLYIFSMGLFKKAVIADTLALFAENGFAMTDLSFAAGWATALSYTFQIYFDFSGYSDMAIGLGRMFNIRIPYNFLSPYKSESFTEFWRKWHITLGRALSTYIYIPLGGNRKGKARTCVNLFLTFLVSGLWHGAAWTFVLWGVLHGCFVVLERLFQDALSKIPHFIRVAVTFLLVNSLWVLFRAESFAGAAEVYKGMVNLKRIGIYDLVDIAWTGVINYPALIAIAYLLTVLTGLLIVVFRCKNSVYRLEHFTGSYKAAAICAMLFCVSLFCISRESPFIYFNF